MVVGLKVILMDKNLIKGVVCNFLFVGVSMKSLWHEFMFKSVDRNLIPMGTDSHP